MVTSERNETGPHSGPKGIAQLFLGVGGALEKQGYSPIVVLKSVELTSLYSSISNLTMILFSRIFHT